MLEDVSNGIAVTYAAPNNCGSVIVFKQDIKTLPIGTVVHELLHAMTHIFRQIGINLSNDTEEVYAYMIDDLVNQFYKQFTKKIK